MESFLKDLHNASGTRTVVGMNTQPTKLAEMLQNTVVAALDGGHVGTSGGNTATQTTLTRNRVILATDDNLGTEYARVLDTNDDDSPVTVYVSIGRYEIDQWGEYGDSLADEVVELEFPADVEAAAAILETALTVARALMRVS